MGFRYGLLTVVLYCFLSPGSALSGEILPDLLLARVYDPALDPTAYWVSEKYDGVRAYWDGRVLRFRSGRLVPAPAWFLGGLPARPLDGELWLGRGRFTELASIVSRQQPVEDDWRQVRYMIFELPEVPGTFTDRIQSMVEIVAGSGTAWLEAVPQFRVPDRESLMVRLNEVVSAGGEGLMLHRADAPYLVGRSEVLLKLTPWLDAEARVVAHLPGKGRFVGMLGALLVERPDGRRFRIGSGFTEAERRQPPPVGAEITYRYRELTPAGMPRFPRYRRLRQNF